MKTNVERLEEKGDAVYHKLCLAITREAQWTQRIIRAAKALERARKQRARLEQANNRTISALRAARREARKAAQIADGMAGQEH